MIVIINTQAIVAAGQGNAIVASELMQPVCFQVDSVPFIHVIHEVTADTSQNAVGVALAYMNAVAGGVICAVQKAQCELCLRLDGPVLVEMLFAAVFSAQADAGIVKSAGNLLAFGIKNSEVAVCIINLEHYVQIMAFIAQVGAVEADGFGLDFAAAAVKAVLAVVIGEGYALIAFQLIRIFYKIIIANLVHGMAVAEAIAAVLTTLDAHPNAFLVSGFMT